MVPTEKVRKPGNKNMKLNKKRILSAAAILAAVLAVLWSGYHNQGTPLSSSAASSSTHPASVASLAGTAASSETVAIDFSSLQAQNPDIYAWITIPGTIVNYPVVQKMDAADPYDNYYLNHTVDFAEGYPGAIYSHPVNALDFTDPVTVLYGHNMKDGSMFSCLHEFENKDFFDQNPMVIIDTPDYTYTYEIFAEVTFSDALLTYDYDFSTPKEVRRYLDDLKSCKGNFNENIAVTEQDKLLTLSTCFADQDSLRLLLIGVLTEKTKH